MKSKFSLLGLTIVSALACLLAPPDADAMSLFLHVERVTNTVPVVVLVPQTNAITGEVTKTPETNLQAVVSATYTPAAGVSNAVAVGQQLAPVVPAPWGEMLAAALGLVAAGTTTWAKLATAKANGALNAQQLTQSALNATIAGVEAVGDANTKAMIQSHAVAAGVADHLDAQVQTVADAMPQFTPKTAPAVPLAQALVQPGAVTKS